MEQLNLSPRECALRVCHTWSIKLNNKHIKNATGKQAYEVAYTQIRLQTKGTFIYLFAHMDFVLKKYLDA
jgi:hypothetical protein